MKIMTFATYRTSTLLHGGQIRLNALHETMLREGFSVRHVSIHTGDESDIRSDEISIALDQATQINMFKRKMRTDVHACSIFDENDNIYQNLKNSINTYDPDVIWLEQPWLWPVVKRYFASRDRRGCSVVYGSQNIEADLIEAAAQEYDKDVRARIAQEVTAMEDELCKFADGIVAVSAADAKQFSVYNKPVIVVPNGVTPKHQPGGLEYWKNQFRNSSLGLFVGSAHPPNAEGFHTMLGSNLSFLAPNEKIVVIGGVCQLIRTNQTFRRNKGLILSRLALLDNQDAGGLSTFFHLSKAILLPIVSGGGTNLKTAEALYSRKPIIATRRAFRGYEDFMNFPNVCISDEPREFQRIVKNRLALPDQEMFYSEAHLEKVDELLWSKTTNSVCAYLKRMVDSAQSLSAREAAASNFKTISVDKNRNKFISEGKLLEPMLHEGWHSFEDRGTWSKSRVAVMKIVNPFNHSDIDINLEVEVLVAPNDHNAIDIYTPSAHHISKVCKQSNRIFSASFRVRDGDIGTGNCIELYFQVQKLIQPRTRINAGDERALGCRVRRIMLQNADNQPSTRQEPGSKISSKFSRVRKFILSMR